MPVEYKQRAYTSNQGSSSEFAARLSILDTVAEVGIEETKKRVRSNFKVTDF
jgi:hypothetical protein